MRLASLLFCAGVVLAQQPIAVGPDKSAGYGLGMVKYFDWYTATPSGGCVNGTGSCVGHNPQGDTYYWTAWLPNASGLPVTSGLPVVGTINDFSTNFSPGCSGNLAMLQLDKFSWATPSASHTSLINCMSSYGTSPGSKDSPAGWNGHLISTDSANDGTWKNRMPFSKGGVLYLPVSRQITTGAPSVHDATFIMSPDSGKHWCNPYTYANRAGGPGCDSSNWDANGDAPKCDSSSSSTPCTNAAYLDSTHSSMMWKALPFGTEAWHWVNYGNQDGATPPAGVNDGCDPATYTCFVLHDGSIARTTSIMNIAAWQYYTCPTITQNYRCSGLAPSSWTANFANRTLTFYQSWYLGGFYRTLTTMSAVTYVKEFGSYLMVGQACANCSPGNTLDFYWAPAPYGPWTQIFKSGAVPMAGNFLCPSPALGYTVVSANPPHIQLTMNANSYEGGSGSQHFSLWDLVLGRTATGGESIRSVDISAYKAGAGYQFSTGNVAGTMPLNGLVWSFDFLDLGVGTSVTDLPFLHEASNSAVMAPCDGGYVTLTTCGSMNSGHGTGMNAYGIQEFANTGYGGHFRSFPFEVLKVPQNAPPAMQGNGSYSVIGVYRYEGVTSFGRYGGIWSTGVSSTSDNTMVELNQSNGHLALTWNATNRPGYQYLSTFGFPNFTNWYFVAVTVQAQSSCGSNCTPTAKIWVGGAATPGVLADTLAGVSYTAAAGTTPAVATRTPNVSAGPLVIGLNANGESTAMTVATTMVYSRALTTPEVQLAYQSLKAKMKERGVTLQ